MATAGSVDLQAKLDEFAWDSLKRTRELFSLSADSLAPDFSQSQRIKLAVKTHDEYLAVKDMPPPTAGAPEKIAAPTVMAPVPNAPAPLALPAPAASSEGGAATTSSAIIEYKAAGLPTGAITARQKKQPAIQPQWHAPWKLMRVISGHLGWVHAVAVDPTNDWFATGSADRTIKACFNILSD